MNKENQLKVFQWNDAVIHTAGTSENPLFCGNDVAKALGYEKYKDAVRRYCKGVFILRTPRGKGGIQKTRYITESDVYRLIMRSHAPHAERFQDWVCEEVLPAIRKTGRYDVRPKKALPFAQAAQCDRVSMEYFNSGELTWSDKQGHMQVLMAMWSEVCQLKSEHDSARVRVAAKYWEPRIRRTMSLLQNSTPHPTELEVGPNGSLYRPFLWG